MRSVLIGIVVLGVLTCLPVTQAAIIQDQTGGSWGIEYASPVGQTFTAVDAEIVSIGFMLSHNCTPTPAATFYISLYSGIGSSGALIVGGYANVSPDHPPFVDDWVDIDVTGTTLTPGNVYSMYIGPDSGHPNFAVVQKQMRYANGQLLDGAVDYAGGHAIFQGSLNTQNDMTFRVLDQPQGVPDSGSALTLLGTALSALGLLRRRFR